MNAVSPSTSGCLVSPLFPFNRASFLHDQQQQHQEQRVHSSLLYRFSSPYLHLWCAPSGRFILQALPFPPPARRNQPAPPQQSNESHRTKRTAPANARPFHRTHLQTIKLHPASPSRAQILISALPKTWFDNKPLCHVQIASNTLAHTIAHSPFNLTAIPQPVTSFLSSFLCFLLCLSLNPHPTLDASHIPQLMLLRASQADR